jgi:hypothetical protein
MCWLNTYSSQLQSEQNNKSTKIFHVSYKYFCNTNTTITTTTTTTATTTASTTTATTSTNYNNT